MKFEILRNTIAFVATVVVAHSALAATVSGKVAACSVKADGTQIYFLTEDKAVCGSSNVIYASSNLDLSPSVADQFLATCIAAKLSGETLYVSGGDCNSNGRMYLNTSGEVRIR